MYVWTGLVGTDRDDPVTRVDAYGAAKDSWRELEPAPIAAQGLRHEPIICTGSQLITYTDPMLVSTPWQPSARRKTFRRKSTTESARAGSADRVHLITGQNLRSG